MEGGIGKRGRERYEFFRLCPTLGYLARDLISLPKVSRKGLLFLLSLFLVCAADALLLLQSTHTHTQVEERETELRGTLPLLVCGEFNRRKVPSGGTTVSRIPQQPAHRADTSI